MSAFAVFWLALIGGIGCVIGLLSGRPWLTGGVLVALSLPLLLIRDLFSVGVAMFVLSVFGALTGSLAATAIREVRAKFD